MGARIPSYLRGERRIRGLQVFYRRLRRLVGGPRDGVPSLGSCMSASIRRLVSILLGGS